MEQIKQAIESLTPAARRELQAWLSFQVTRDRLQFRRRFALARSVMATVLALLTFIGIEAALFHSGWYNKYLEPNSTTGQVEYNLFWLRRTWPSKAPDVLVIGDSRIAEGFSARTAGAVVNGRVHFINFGMPGSSPRVWYYTLRDMEKDRNRFAAIVIAFDRYSDLDGGEDPRNRPTDLSYLAGRLAFRDCWEFSRSYTDPEARHSMLVGCLFRGIPLHADVRDFLAGISERRKRAKDWRDNGAGYIDGYGGKPETLAGLAFDPARHAIGFPPGTKDWQMSSAKATLLPDPAPQTGALTAYRRRWIGGILDLYKDAQTRIVFLQLPNAPLPVAESNIPARFVDSVRSRQFLSILPADTFRDLQRPELFADGLHLDSAGRKIFSERLAKVLEPMVAKQ